MHLYAKIGNIDTSRHFACKNIEVKLFKNYYFYETFHILSQRKDINILKYLVTSFTFRRSDPNIFIRRMMTRIDLCRETMHDAV